MGLIANNPIMWLFSYFKVIILFFRRKISPSNSKFGPSLAIPGPRGYLSWLRLEKLAAGHYAGALEALFVKEEIMHQ